MIRWGFLGDGNGQFTDAAGIGADALGHIHVVDRRADRIEKFDKNCRFITAWVSPGVSNGQFNKISDVTVGLVSKVYVSDYGNNNVQESYQHIPVCITSYVGHQNRMMSYKVPIKLPYILYSKR